MSGILRVANDKQPNAKGQLSTSTTFSRAQCETDAIKLSQHLAKASISKLQYVQQEVRFLGHDISTSGTKRGICNPEDSQAPDKETGSLFPRYVFISNIFHSKLYHSRSTAPRDGRCDRLDRSFSGTLGPVAAEFFRVYIQRPGRLLRIEPLGSTRGGVTPIWTETLTPVHPTVAAP